MRQICYYKLRELLQIATILLQNTTYHKIQRLQQIVTVQ